MTLELVKPAPAPVEPAKKNKQENASLSYMEALDAIQVYDKKIAEAAKNLVLEVIDPKEIACNASAKKIFISAGLTVVGAIGAKIAGVDAVIMGNVALGGFGGLMAVPFFWFNGSLGKLVSPFKYRAAKQQLETDLPLVELKEAEYAKKEAKILKKAQPVINTINTHLQYENRRVVLSGEHGYKNFKIVEAEKLNEWEIEKLKFEKTASLVALPSLDKKSITA